MKTIIFSYLSTLSLLVFLMMGGVVYGQQTAEDNLMTTVGYIDRADMEDKMAETGEELPHILTFDNAGGVVEGVGERTASLHLIYGREELSDVEGNHFSYSVGYDLYDLYGSELLSSGELTIDNHESDGSFEDVAVQKCDQAPIARIRYICMDVNGVRECMAKTEEDVPEGAQWLGAGNSLVSDFGDIRLELRLNSEKAYFLDGNATYGDYGMGGETYFYAVPGNDNRVGLAWKHVLGAEKYEIKYFFIDSQYDGGQDYGNFFLERIRKGAVVETDKNWHEMELTYPEGSFYYSIRPVGRFTDGGGYAPKWAGWSPFEEITISETGDFPPFEPSHNWQFSASFAEEGKSKKVVSYFDGTMRSRQTVTHLNDEDVTLVAETDYSLEGQGTVSILPAPVRDATENNLSFKMAFNTAEGSAIPYSHKDFDKTGGADKLSDQIGAGKYFSPANDFEGIYRDYIPNADGYPLTQARYLRDATGRVESQGGVGAFFQLGEGHDTRYLYGNATSTALKRLFGSDVGDASHYRKNFVVDANGQVSTAYVDMAGRTVATALVGVSPENVLQLDGVGVENVKDDILTNLEVSDNTIRHRHSIVNSIVNTPYTFEYDLDAPNNLFESDGGLEYCEDCSYELSFRIRRESDGVLMDVVPLSGNPNNESTEKELRFDLSGAPCTGSGGQDNAVSFKCTFDEIASYTVIKELKVTGGNLEAFVEDYLLSEGLSYEALELQYIQDIDYSGCDITCEAHCKRLVLQENPSWSYENGVVTENGQDVTDQFNDSLVLRMEEICDAIAGLGAISAYSMGECGSYRNDMIAQIAPAEDNVPDIATLLSGQVSGGEHMLVITDADYNDVEIVFGENGYITSIGGDGSLTYVDDGDIILETGGIPSFGTLEEFRDNVYLEHYQEGWAETMVVLHREYCHYMKCRDHLPSKEFSTELATYKTISEATGNDYSNSLFSLLLAASGTDNCQDPNLNVFLADIIALDPFFSAPAIGTHYAVDMEAHLINEFINFETPNGTECVWDIMHSIILNGTNSPEVGYADYTVEQQEELAWTLLRGYYEDIKERMFWNADILDTGSCGFLSGDDAVFVPPTPLVEFAPAPDEDGISDAQMADLQGEFDNIMENICMGKADYWTSQLLDYLLVSCNIDLTNNETVIYGDADIADLGIWGHFNAYCINNADAGTLGTGFDFLVAIEQGDVSNDPDLLAIQQIIDDNNTGGVACPDIFDSVISDNVSVLAEEIESCYIELFELFNNAISGEDLTDWNIVNGISYEYVAPSSGGGCYDSFVGTMELDFNGFVADFGINDINSPVINSFGCDHTAYGYYVLNGEQPPTGNITIVSFTELGRREVVEIDGGLYSINGQISNTPHVYTGFGMELNYVDATGNEGTVPVALVTRIGCAFLEAGAPTTEVISEFACEENLQAIAIAQAQDEWSDIVDAVASLYNVGVCLEVNEKFTVSHDLVEHQYTLYYYDQAGNLVQTVPPEGVDFAEMAENSDGLVELTEEPQHRLKTIYRYNSLNQIVWQTSPDGGDTEFYYDDLQRIRVSQNAKQADEGMDYSYTRYDRLGRITEVGQIDDTNMAAATLVTTENLNDMSFPSDDVQELSQRVWTFYDDTFMESANWFEQNNLRGRVSAVVSEESSGYTAYNYDIHGNVISMAHRIPHVGEVLINYDFDLISGNVKEVAYQPGKADQYYHRYEYDADNRLRYTHTSGDGVIWEQEARYFYYLHGPLARVEIGHDMVQAQDYYYNMQGWIKGVNQPDSYMEGNIWTLGRDGLETANNQNRYVALDEYAYQLNYFQGDYRPIGGEDNYPMMAAMENMMGQLASDESIGFQTTADGTIGGLFNGNIASMITDIRSFGDDREQMMAYQYDQLHRIKTSKSYGKNNQTWSSNGRYASEYSYDKNGNLLSLKRFHDSGNPFDNLSYDYNLNGDGQLVDNRLRRVHDTSTTPLADMSDFRDQEEDGNYEYDDIGNLVRDYSEKIDEIVWNIQGKVTDVIFTAEGIAEGKKNIHYTYDATGNRLTKKVGGTTTIYARDASGNVMSVYQHSLKSTVATSYGTLWQKEVPIYGSSRLGMDNVGRVIWRAGQSGSVNSAELYAGRLHVAEVLYDSPATPDGFSSETHKGEYVMVFNSSTEMLDLEGIRLRNGTDGQSHSFTPGTMLEPGRGMIVAYGSPSDEDDVRKLANIDTRLQQTEQFTGMPMLWYWQTDMALDDAGGSVMLEWYGTDGAEDDYVLDLMDYGSLGIQADNPYFDISVYDTDPLPVRLSVKSVMKDMQTIAVEAILQRNDYYLSLANELSAGEQAEQIRELQGRMGQLSQDLAEGIITQEEYNERNLILKEELEGLESGEVSTEALKMIAESFYSGNRYKVKSYERRRGDKMYELSNHLSNVLVTVSDKKLGILGGNDEFAYYEAKVLHASDYYPFGWTMPERKVNSGDYRYGFNGMEREDDLTGTTSHYDFGARIYDNRIGRWLSLDPMMKKYPHLSAYNGFENNPIYFADPDGKDAIVKIVKNENGKGGTITISTTIYIYGDVEESMAETLTTAAAEHYVDRQYQASDDPEDTYTVKFDVKYEYAASKPTTVKQGDNLLEYSPENLIRRGRQAYAAETYPKTEWRVPFGNYYNEDGTLLPDVGVSDITFGLTFAGEGKPLIPTLNYDGDPYWLESGSDDGFFNEYLYSAYTGTIYKYGTLAESVIHETWHFLGMSDRYQKNTTSGLVERMTGFENDMASGGMNTAVSQIHINNLAKFALDIFEKFGRSEFNLQDKFDVKAKDGKAYLKGGYDSEGNIDMTKEIEIK